MCCNCNQNRKGVKCILILDMVLFFNLLRSIFAYRAYRNMEENFVKYAKVRQVTFWLQTVWLIANLLVCIYVNVWAGEALNYIYLIAVIVFIVIVTVLDFHYLQCVLFLMNHLDRLRN